MKDKERILHLIQSKAKVNVMLGGGEDPSPGFINIDIRKLPTVDIIHDLEKFPWPFPSNSVDLLVASHLVEHLQPHGGVFIDFMNEAWRICKNGASFMIAAPYGTSTGFVQDPSHCNPVNEVTWSYFDPFDKISNGILYRVYRPMPWEIVENEWSSEGNIEVLLKKRPDEVTYHDVYQQI